MARVNRGRRNRRGSMLPEITLTPLIDTALTLLVIFMIATPMLQNSLKIELPKGKMGERTNSQRELIIEVAKDGRVACGDKVVKFDALEGVVKRAIGSKKDQTVFVKADQASNYGQVIKVVDALKQIDGVAYVALATNAIQSS